MTYIIFRLKKHPIKSMVLVVVLLICVLEHERILRLIRGKCDQEMKSINVSNTLCSINFDDRRIYVNSKTDWKTIYFVTPTYPRPEQVPELTRLAHTLMHVPRLHWIVADDQPLCSDQVATILRRSKLPYTHISSPKPYTYKCIHPKGVANRRAALAWLIKNKMKGILYFGDDDNAVDLQLFDEIRKTKRISMFPVGLIGGYRVSSPIIENGKVAAFFDSWPSTREFPVDMAGFAINIELLSWSAKMPYQAGNEENGFLQNLGVKFEDIEPLADNCSKVLVWHTKTKKFKMRGLNININQLDNIFVQRYQSFVELLKEVYRLGLAKPNLNDGSSLLIRNSSTYGILIGLT